MNLIAKEHNEWISFLDRSGPFLSLPVLLEIFPNGLDKLDTNTISNLRSAYEEWLEEKDNIAIHSAWIDYVLENFLGYPSDLLLKGQAIPSNLSAYLPQQALTLRPDRVLIESSTKQPRLLIQKYHHTQKLDHPPYSETSMSCLTRMMELLHASQVPLGLITNGEEWVLVHAPVGETSSYITFYANLWFLEQSTLFAFYSLLHLGRFFGVPEEDTLPSLFKRSAENQHEVTDQLGSQVRSAVQVLIQAFDKADQDSNRKLLQGLSPDALYEAAITVLMRLVFLLYAEERELLPINEQVFDLYYAISTLSDQLRSEADRFGEEVLERNYDAWSRLLSTSRMVFTGVRHDRLNLPAYGGSLFDPDRFAFLEGRSQGSDWASTQAQPLLIDNRTVLHILENIQYLYISDYRQRQRLSFRALDIEQIGHIYEGLLEYKAARAEAVMLGLPASRDYPLPFITLTELEGLRAKGLEALSKKIHDLTGKSPASIKKLLNKSLDLELSARLRLTCQNNDTLYHRVLPFANLIREDDYQNLVLIQPGSVYVTRGNTRRATGTHYTPRSLTEPIVQHTLEPMVYNGPAEGLPEEQWTLQSPAKLLELKICDMAMGSGSFLVQVIRYLSERLVESWQKIAPLSEPGLSPQSFWSPEGKALEAPTGEELPNDLDSRYLLARRLIADRCIYGVDKNPLAVEMAKLSIWLATMDKDRPFTFLDHALKCGDSLVGVDEKDFLSWARSRTNTSTWSLFDEGIKEELDHARSKRKELEAFQVRDMTDLAMKETLLEEAEQAAQRIKLGCDLLVGARLQGLRKNELEAEESALLLQWMAGETDGNYRCQRALTKAHKERAFHWFLEFPEVFEKEGFDAFVGNPPFLGGMRIRGDLGGNYLDYIRRKFTNSGNRMDLCAYFFRQGSFLCKRGSILGLIGTNTIAQGDTLEGGLAVIGKYNWTIYHAHSSMIWPGTAAVFISLVHLINADYHGKKYLDNKVVNEISVNLSSYEQYRKPEILKSNTKLCYQGFNPVGMGFTVNIDYAKKLINQDIKYRDVLFPFLNGKELNQSPNQEPSRWIIYFHDWSIEKAMEYPKCFDHVKENVYPQRAAIKQTTSASKNYLDKWWLFGVQSPILFRILNEQDQVIAIALTSKTAAFVMVSAKVIFSHALGVFPTDSFGFFAVLQSSFHVQWAWLNGSSLKGDLRYTVKDIVETFPFPQTTDELELLGKTYHSIRKDIMQAKNVGLTELFNLFNDPEEKFCDISHLRELFIHMDNAVAAAYKWNDLDLGHGFHETPQGLRFTISEEARREVLKRLLELNHQRHEEEVRAGLAKPDSKDKTKSSASSKPKAKKKAKPAQALTQQTKQIDLGFKVDNPSEPRLEIEPRPDGALSIDQLERWQWYRCAACGATVMGFSAEEHIQEKHGHVDVGFLAPMQ